MGKKEEELMAEILERVGRIEENMQNMQFAIVQIQGMMGKGGVSPQGSTPSDANLTAVLDKLNRIESLLESQGPGMGAGSSSNLTEEIVKANQNVARALETIEKGLKTVDLEVTMMELRDRLEELLMNLESKYMSKTE